jgi:acylphosphatase
VAALLRQAIRVRGSVQGVGFRPFVYRLAHEEQLTGWVCNDAEGVLLEVQGAAARGPFRARLQSDAPPLARVLQVEATPCPALADESGFTILASRGGAVRTAIPPDTATCADCLAELFDPADRRHRYGFINCTQCGPRYTLTRQPALRPGDDQHGTLHRSARLPARIHRPRAPPLPCRAQRLPGVRASSGLGGWRRYAAARPAGRRHRRGAGGCCMAARSSPSRAWAAFIWPAMRATPAAVAACANASTATKSPLR